MVMEGDKSGHHVVKVSLTWLLNALDSATITTTRLPKATVNNHADWHNAFILAGAWEKKGLAKQAMTSSQPAC